MTAVTLFLYVVGCFMATVIAEVLPGHLSRLARYSLVAFWPLWACWALVFSAATRLARVNVNWWRHG